MARKKYVKVPADWNVINGPALVIVFPHGKPPWAGFQPDDAREDGATLEDTLDWLDRAYPSHGEFARECIDTLLNPDG